ncbi:MAG: hypothetical protein NT015_00035 [Alphaproteobacteria bacterium]|nr:hypothetical protein [Alphaproteobacteria bacterium]
MDKKRKQPRAKQAVVQAPEAPEFVANRSFPIIQDATDTRAVTARKLVAQVIAPEAAATRVLRASEANSAFGDVLDSAGSLEELRRIGERVIAGDLSRPESMLVNQAVGLETLSARLIERGMAQTGLPQFEAFMRLGLKAQAQSRLAIEALGTLKHGPTVIAKQANLSGGGPMQVNNGHPRAHNSEKTPNGLLNHEQGMDAGEARGADESDPTLAAVGKIERT